MESTSWGRAPQAQVDSDFDLPGVKFHTKFPPFLFQRKRKRQRETSTNTTKIKTYFHLFYWQGGKKRIDFVPIWKHCKICELLIVCHEDCQNIKMVSCAKVPINPKLHNVFFFKNITFKRTVCSSQSVWSLAGRPTKQSVLLTSWSGQPTQFQTVFLFLSTLSRTETFVLGLDKKQKMEENWKRSFQEGKF